MNKNNTTTPRIVFWGTPSLARCCLTHIYENGFPLCGIVTQPDKPVGRKQILTAPPVKQFAQSHNIPYIQPARLRNNTDALATLSAWQPDICVVVAYGHIIPDEMLDLPRYFINLHFSLLPHYRGAAPVQYALLNGDKKTGVTIQHLASQMDAGDIIQQKEIAIDINDTTAKLWEKCTHSGSLLLCDTLSQLCDGTAPRISQNHSHATYAPKLKKNTGFISWKSPALTIHNTVRACNPWPGAQCLHKTRYIKIWKTNCTDTPADLPAGTLQWKDNTLLCATNDYYLAIEEIQPAGSRRMDAKSFCAGHDIKNMRLASINTI
jgi:methionyl-tRNA formyltransferase